MNFAPCFNDTAALHMFESASFYAKVRAIRLAAEEKNYDAFDGMVRLFLDERTNPDFMTTIAKCNDWRMVQKMAEKDEKLSGLLNKAQRKTIHRPVRRTIDPTPAPVAPMAAPAPLLTRLKFW